MLEYAFSVSWVCAPLQRSEDHLSHHCLLPGDKVSVFTTYIIYHASCPGAFRDSPVSHHTVRVPQLLLYSVLYAFWGFNLGPHTCTVKCFSSLSVPATLQNCLTATHKPPVGKLTVNSPVTASKPTWMVCSKSDGGEISGRSFSFFLLPRGHGGGERK